MDCESNNQNEKVNKHESISEDDVVSSLEARALSDAHGNTDMRLIEGAGHHLRHDPRAIAILLGWLDKQRRVNK